MCLGCKDKIFLGEKNQFKTLTNDIKTNFAKLMKQALVHHNLVEAVIEQGRNISYTSMRLNTNRRMPEAQKLYRSLGFEDIEPYEHFEVDGMVFMELKLT